MNHPNTGTSIPISGSACSEKLTALPTVQTASTVTLLLDQSAAMPQRGATTIETRDCEGDGGR